MGKKQGAELYSAPCPLVNVAAGIHSSKNSCKRAANSLGQSLFTSWPALGTMFIRALGRAAAIVSAALRLARSLSPQSTKAGQAIWGRAWVKAQGNHLGLCKPGGSKSGAGH